MTALMLAITTQPKNASKTGPGSIRIIDQKTKAEQNYSARADIVKTLVEHGVDLTLKNNAGKTALDLARENGNEEILSILQSTGGSAAKP